MRHEELQQEKDILSEVHLSGASLPFPAPSNRKVSHNSYVC
jgi:hypothetical protein